LAYLEDRGLNLERANFLEWLRKFSDAAEVHLEEGRTPRAIQLFLKDQNTARASECVLRGFWEKLSFAVMPHTQDSLVSHLLDLAAQIDVSLVSRSTNDEVRSPRLSVAKFERRYLLHPDFDVPSHR
jgi:hypothetical protein